MTSACISNCTVDAFGESSNRSGLAINFFPNLSLKPKLSRFVVPPIDAAASTSDNGLDGWA